MMLPIGVELDNLDDINTELINVCNANYSDDELSKKIIQLTSEGADVNAADRDGNTPLINIVKRNRVNEAKLLIELGANVNANNHSEDTSLTIAARRGYTSVIRLLAESGVALNAINGNGYTALIIALFNNQFDAADVLLAVGTDINFICPNGDSALHSAAISGHIKPVQYCLEHGADYNLVNSAQATVLEMVSDNRFRDVETYIQAFIENDQIIKSVNAEPLIKNIPINPRKKSFI